jgi:hypothetical protein
MSLRIARDHEVDGHFSRLGVMITPELEWYVTR